MYNFVAVIKNISEVETSIKGKYVKN